MAELDPITTSPHRRLAPQVGSSPPSPFQQQKPHNFITSFLSRATAFVVFAALLPVFPSQAPEFLNQTLLTRSWELLHLLLVGIAVCYGLFSHRNADLAAEKEALQKPDTPQSYLTQLLQVSPVFDDDEPETQQPGPDENKLQMWSSRYHREQPTVVVAQGSRGDGGSVGKRLLLPIRSLRSRIPDAESRGKEGRQEAPHAIAGGGSRVFLRGRAEDGNGGQVGTRDPPAKEEDLAGNRIIHPSPIPWRARAGSRMEVKEEACAGPAPSSHSLPSPTATEMDAGTFRSPSFRSSRPTSAASSPRKPSPPAPPVPPEPRAQDDDDSGKKNTLYKPPPPPPFGHRPPNPPPDDKKPNRSPASPRSSRFHTRPRSDAEGYYSVGRSVRTVRSREVLPEAMADGGATKLDPFTVTTPAGGEASPKPMARVRTQHRTEAKKKKKETGFEDRVVVDSEESEGGPDASEAPRSAAPEEEENEVDKKADEFIARFREQIRLQRIESIKRSAGQRGPARGHPS